MPEYNGWPYGPHAESLSKPAKREAHKSDTLTSIPETPADEVTEESLPAKFSGADTEIGAVDKAQTEIKEP